MHYLKKSRNLNNHREHRRERGHQITGTSDHGVSKITHNPLK